MIILFINDFQFDIYVFKIKVLVFSKLNASIIKNKSVLFTNQFILSSLSLSVATTDAEKQLWMQIWSLFVERILQMYQSFF
jgi:hypothetical protein